MAVDTKGDHSVTFDVTSGLTSSHGKGGHSILSAAYSGLTTFPDTCVNHSCKTVCQPRDFKELSPVPTEEKVEIEVVALRRDIGLISCISYTVGIIIGSGIFIFPQGTMVRTGSVGLCLTVWTIGGIMAFLGSLCFIELGRQVQRSGGSYSFLKETYGPLVAFFLAWTQQFITNPAAYATTALTFAEYTMSLTDLCGSPVRPTKVVALTFILTVALINGHSTGLSAPVQVIGTFVKLAALVVIVVGGIVRIGQGQTETLSTGFENSETSVSMIAWSFFYVNFAYSGSDCIFYVYEELKNPRRNIILASAGGLAVVTVVYVLANVSYLTVLTTQELMLTPAVAAVWATRVLPGSAILIPLCVLVSIFSGSSGGAFTTSRVTFAAARDGLFPEFLSYVSVRRYTPLPAILINALLTVLFVVGNDISETINFLTFITNIGLFFIFLAVFILRYRRRPNAELDFKVPLVIPAVMVAFTLFVLVLPVVLQPSMNYLYAVLLTLAGLLYYIPVVHFRLRLAFLDPVFAYLQLLLEVAPTSEIK